MSKQTQRDRDNAPMFTGRRRKARDPCPARPPAPLRIAHAGPGENGLAKARGRRDLPQLARHRRVVGPGMGEPCRQRGIPGGHAQGVAEAAIPESLPLGR